ncbi:aldehyde dehydrogenase family protein [Nonomuraea monospora]|uniref:Aldehyde dehydrogenase family protein n=1 Tax=Nonomuraea monospora TaxID=568818 RepID=A0ABN3D0I8_9ACTN
MPTAIPTIQPLVAGEPMDTHDRSDLVGVHGARVAEVGLAAPLTAVPAVKRVRDAADGVPPGQETLSRAAEILLTEEVNGESPEDYLIRCALATGVPKPVVRDGLHYLARVLTDVQRHNALDLPPIPDVDGVAARWIPRGRLFSMLTNLGTHSGGNSLWVRALSIGYSVMIRPGRADPFTPHRLMGALLAAGVAPEKLTLLPGPDRLGHLLVEHADAGAVQGPPKLTRQWERRRDVRVNGPGRSKLVIDHEPSAAELDYLLDTVLGDGGVRCDNVSAILTTEDPGALADALAERLAATPAHLITDDRARLPAVSAERAVVLRKHLGELAAGLADHTAPHYGGDPLAALDDGSYAVRPVVLSAPSSGHPAVHTELTSPFVVVAPWLPAEGVAPLRDSLVVTVLGDDHLARLAENEPRIGRVVTAPVLPWATMPPSLYGDGLMHMLAVRKTTVIGGGRS